MVIPSFERPSNFFLYTGLAALIYIFSFLINSGENVDQKKYDGNLKIIQLNCDRQLDSAECETLSKKLLRLKTLSPSLIEEINNIEFTITKKKILNRRRNNEIELIDTNINNISSQYDYDSSGFPQMLMLTLAILWTGTGVFLLTKEHESKSTKNIDNVINSYTDNKFNLRQRLKKHFKK